MRHWLLTYDEATRLLLLAPRLLLLLVVALAMTHVVDVPARKWVWKVLAGLAVLMLAVQPYLALKWAPPEQYMGDTGRIIYMHVPQLQVAMLALCLNFGCAVAFLFRKSFVTDALAEATAEVGVYFGGVGVLLGSIWAKPTWGAWWTWDPRLTTSAILLVVYFGYLALRRFIEDPDKRATWSAVMGIIAFVDIPVLWFSVIWWRSMHQVQSPASKLDPQMGAVLSWSTAMFLALAVVFIYQRFLVAYESRCREVALPSSLPVEQEA
jgi:heme exporter protein C